MHPATFLQVLGPSPWRCAYVQPSRRPADGRYGENPFRLGKHLQLQVVLKPSPDGRSGGCTCGASSGSASSLAEHDIRFEEDNWESPTLGAWGVGWQVVMDGMEITQFTYFQQAGGIDLVADHRRDHVWPRADRDVPRRRSTPIYDVMWNESLSYGQVRRAGRGRALAVLLRDRRRRSYASSSSTATSRRAGRALAAGLRPAGLRGRRSPARTRSTSSTPAAPSRRPTGSASSAACAISPAPAPARTSPSARRPERRRSRPAAL